MRFTQKIQMMLDPLAWAIIGNIAVKKHDSTQTAIQLKIERSFASLLLEQVPLS